MSAANSPTLETTALPSREELLARAQAWEQVLLSGPITYFPIRHHSPACARHLRQWIEHFQPESIIIEGPGSHDDWIPLLVSHECIGPVALLSTYRESDSPTGLRHSAFYPLCDYSPEWVALRQGHAQGARVRFADLEFGEKVRIKHAQLQEGESPQTLLGVLLGDESNLRYSEFIEKLVRRLGCRDFDELWDHLFEARSETMTTEAFLGLLATYCDLSRASYQPEYLKADGTLAREAIMVEVIRSEYEQLRDPKRQGALLVVTGGFHTVALPEVVSGEGNPHRSKSSTPDPAKSGSWLIRYSYDQLDALSGYRSGMPSPGFYDVLWQADQANMPKRDEVARLVTIIARETRGKPIPHEASVTDSIAAVQMLDRLADLRGHTTPTRSDVLDAIASCMRKESGVGEDLLSAIVHRVLAGNRIGSIPPAAGQPPIIHDFHRQATSYRLPINTIEPRNVHLELYRKPQHRAISFFLHQLQLLTVPYAEFVDGPDFIHGYRLSRLQEEWRVVWSPNVEARLAELASLGDSVAGATAQQIVQLVRDLDEAGSARDADAAVELLIRTCRCGLHTHAERILPVVQSHIAEDSSFASIAKALSGLALLRSAREPLEAERLDSLDQIILHCYHRATYLIDTLSEIPDDQLDSSLDGLLSVRELLTNQVAETEYAAESVSTLDAQLFFESLERLIDSTKAPRSEIAGAAAGILYGSGYIDQQRVCGVVQQYLDAAVEDIGAACGVVRGMMMTAREAFWRLDDLLRSLDTLFQRWEEGRFNHALPHMRLAFSQLSPKEVDSVAERVAQLHHVETVGKLTHPEISEEDMQFALRITELMNQSLKEDGLL